MNAYLVEHNANFHGAFRTSRESDAVLEKARSAAADFLNTRRPEEIVFGSNMTSLTFNISRSLARTWNPGDEIVFSSDAAKSGGLFSSARLTSGRMFVKNGKLNCIFGNINIRTGNMNDYDRDAYDDDDPRREYGGSLARLTTNDWQELVVGKKGVHYNWIAIEIEQAMAAKTNSERARKARAIKRRTIEQERERESVYWEDWEPDKALPTE